VTVPNIEHTPEANFKSAPTDAKPDEV